MNNYRAVRLDHGADKPHTGLIGYFRTAAAAESAIRHASGRLRRKTGEDTTHLYAIQFLLADEWLTSREIQA